MDISKLSKSNKVGTIYNSIKDLPVGIYIHHENQLLIRTHRGTYNGDLLEYTPEDINHIIDFEEEHKVTYTKIY